jgi:hypothetical protein
MNWEAFKTPEKVIRFWKKGGFAQPEFRFMLFQTLTPDTLEEFLRLVPADVLAELKQEARTCPTIESEWGQMRIIKSWCGPWNDEIAERVRREDQESIQRYRRGVETLRSHMASERDTTK